MLKSVEGTFKDGRVELTELPPPGTAGRVIVTFVNSPAQVVDLAEHGVTSEQAADLRYRLTTFCEDWQRPEMDAYDAL